MSTSIATLLALLPPLALMVYVYLQDKVEREPVSLIIKTILLGAGSAIPVMIVEVFLENCFNMVIDLESIPGMILDNFIGVALVEEFFKMYACKLSVWKNREFNYTFDGVVYAVASTIGFATLENVLYVFYEGTASIETALIRAVTAIPGHTIFGIYMGLHLGLAKYEKMHGHESGYLRHMVLAVLIPTFIHGTYDFIASFESMIFTVAFIVFLVLMDILAVRSLKRFEEEDREIYPNQLPPSYTNYKY